MSEPVSNAEIEDVLSSIRRLVAGDRKGNAMPRKTAAHIDPPVRHQDTSKEEALLLSPSLRVASSEPQAAQDPTPEVAHQAVDAPDIRNAKLSEPVSVESVSFGPEAEEVSAGVHDESTPPLTEDPIMDNLEYPAFGRRSLGVEDLPSEDEAYAAIAEASTTSSAVRVDDSSTEDGNVSALPRAGFLFGSLREETHAAFPDEHVDMDAASFSTDIEPPALETSAFDDAPEAACRITEEPVANLATDTAEGDREAFDTSEARHQVTAEAFDASEPALKATSDEEAAPPPEGKESETNLFAAPVEEFDDSALRALITELLREELQGALGERITTNIRKLVRTEIRRALTEQDWG